MGSPDPPSATEPAGLRAHAFGLLNNLGIVGPNIPHRLQTEPDPKWTAEEMAVWIATRDDKWCVCGRIWPCEAAALGDVVAALASPEPVEGPRPEPTIAHTAENDPAGLYDDSWEPIHGDDCIDRMYEQAGVATPPASETEHTHPVSYWPDCPACGSAATSKAPPAMTEPRTKAGKALHARIYRDGQPFITAAEIADAILAIEAEAIAGCEVHPITREEIARSEAHARREAEAAAPIDVERLARAFGIVVERTPGLWVDYSGPSHKKGGISASRKAFLREVAAEYATTTTDPAPAENS